jgi:glutathionylspermidine amidase/synthetase
MRTTDHILQYDHLLAKFNLPRAVWPRIRQSWNNRRNQMITGRFDFAVSAEGIKVYEYNADSAACYLECGKVQGRWAQHYGCNNGDDSGKPLVRSLIEAWEHSEVDGVLHIMQDQEPEETYHALFMKSIMEQAGICCKTIRGVNGLAWNRSGRVIDADGVEIKWVWKTWAWETALDQLRVECEVGDYPFDTIRKHAPRLVDVLFNKEVMVFEPLWTLIPSNKAILPIMWSEFPNHRYLLEAQFSLTNHLLDRGYVIKPIAGRCGCNISLIDDSNAVLDETNGRFSDQDQIYQALHRLPLIDGYHVQLSTFSAAGRYAGCCVRVDPSPVIKQDSDVMPLRILADVL